MTESAHGFSVRQEDDVLPSRHLVRLGLAAAFAFAVGVFVAGVILAARIGTLRPDDAGPEGTRPATSEIARIEQTPVRYARAGIDLRAAQERALERWGWADRDAGIARIPIERAIDVVVQEAAR